MVDEWPPQADDATLWREFTPRTSREAVLARQAPLWGRQVWVAEFDGEWRVWCPDCLSFLGLDVLGKPYNGHAVGIRTASGTIVPLIPGDDGPTPPPLRRFRDLMREPW